MTVPFSILFILFLKMCMNQNDKVFFTDLLQYLTMTKGFPIILGGDWNATYSTCPTKLNNDLFNMSCPPSTIRSGWISDICREVDLLDPYRAFHPTTKEFTFVPRAGKKNRSRLDFFLINSGLLPLVKSCEIADCITNSLFDHKSIPLVFYAIKLVINYLLIAPSLLILGRMMLSLPPSRTPIWHTRTPSSQPVRVREEPSTAARTATYCGRYLDPSP